MEAKISQLQACLNVVFFAMLVMFVFQAAMSAISNKQLLDRLDAISESIDDEPTHADPMDQGET